jgi:VanZ family protein
LTIFIQSSFPAIEIPKTEIIALDKIIHIGIYGLLAALCYISLIHVEKDNFLSRRPFIWSAVITIIYGLSDEIHQHYVPNRSAEVQDWLADVIGILLMMLLINYYFKKRYILFGKELANGA